MQDRVRRRLTRRDTGGVDEPDNLADARRLPDQRSGIRFRSRSSRSQMPPHAIIISSNGRVFRKAPLPPDRGKACTPSRSLAAGANRYGASRMIQLRKYSSAASHFFRSIKSSTCPQLVAAGQHDAERA
jgi:hypothetical protein